MQQYQNEYNYQQHNKNRVASQHHTTEISQQSQQHTEQAEHDKIGQEQNTYSICGRNRIQHVHQCEYIIYTTSCVMKSQFESLQH